MKPVHWMGSSLKDIRAMPADVQDAFGHALYFAQIGHKHAGAKPLKGFRAPEFSKLLKTMMAIPTGPSTQSEWFTPYTCSTCSRRNRSEALQLRRPILTSSGND